MSDYNEIRRSVWENRKLRMEKLSPTPEELELFEQLWADYSKNYHQETVWTAPELDGNDSLHNRWWEWAQIAKIGPESDLIQEQEEREEAEQLAALKKAAQGAESVQMS
jgi:hypothetical protein